MACVPPRPGSDTSRKILTAQGVELSKHCKMKQILGRSSLWHKSCRGCLPVLNSRNLASQAVIVEEMEASEPSEASEKKTMRWQRWKAHEIMALIEAKKQQHLRGVESTEAAVIELKKTRNKWKEIEDFCREKGIERSAQQCQARWSRLMSAFTQIRSWEETRKPEQPSFWFLKLDERKTMGFLQSLDQKTYNALDELYNSKADAIENTLVKDDVEGLPELGSANHLPDGYDGKNYHTNKADLNCSHVQGEAHEGNNKTNLQRTCGYKSDDMVHVQDSDYNIFSKECKHEKQADPSKAMESTKILCKYLQMVVDDNNGARLLHDSAGKMDLNPTDQHTDEQVESLNVSGIAEHTNPLIRCDQKDVNAKAQILLASAEMIDGSNKDMCEGRLMVVDECNKAKLFHASAEYVDCNVTNLHTGQQLESLKSSGIADRANPMVGCDQKDANDTAQLLPASAKLIDGSEKDLSKGSVEALNANQSRQIAGTASSCISIDKQDCINLSEDGVFGEEAWVDKNEKDEGFFEVPEVKSFFYPENADADIIQSNFIDSQNKYDARQMGEGTVTQLNNLVPIMEEACVRPQMVLHTRFEQQHGDFNPLRVAKEEIGTEVLNQGPEDNTTSPSSKNFESICSDQHKDSVKNDLQPSKEGHIEAVERNATLDCSTGHSFEEQKVQHLQNCNNDDRGKATEPGRNIKHFEVPVKDVDLFVKREPCDQTQSVYDRDGTDTIERMKVANIEDDHLSEKMEIRVSSVCEGKRTIKRDGVSFESVCEAKRVEVLEVAAKELESTIKDDRGLCVTSGKGSMEDRSQKTTTSSRADEDVVAYIPAAIGNLVRTALETIRKIFKF